MNGPWPRRVPDLRRLARGEEFRQHQSATAGWADRHFELIDEQAPWLDPAGRWISDHCETSLRGHPWSIPPDPPGVSCTRDVTAVYGAEGELDDRLAGLRAALSRAGWELSLDPDPAEMGLRESVMGPFEWSATGRSGLPDGLETIPPSRLERTASWMRMGVGWTSRGGPPGLRTTRESVRSGDPRVATALYQPVEVAGTGVDGLASQALTRHQHAIAVGVNIVYYINFNVNARPGRLRKRLLPVARTR